MSTHRVPHIQKDVRRIQSKAKKASTPPTKNAKNAELRWPIKRKKRPWKMIANFTYKFSPPIPKKNMGHNFVLAIFLFLVI